MIVEVDHPEFGRLREVRSPIRTAGEIRTPSRAPKLGEHTDAILSEILQYSASTIANTICPSTLRYGAVSEPPENSTSVPSGDQARPSSPQ